MSKNKKDSLLELAEKVKNAISGLSELENEVKSAIAGLAEENGFNPDTIEWVDLGLPSKRLWAKEGDGKFYTHDEAVDFFGDNLPKSSAFAELFEECTVEWDAERKGIELTGPNGNKLFFPAAGYKSRSGEICGVGEEGNYWSRTPYCKSEKSFAPYSQASARNLYFSSGYINPLDRDDRSSGFSVRPSRENF